MSRQLPDHCGALQSDAPPQTAGIPRGHYTSNKSSKRLRQIKKRVFCIGACIGACFRASHQSVSIQTALNRLIFVSLNRPVSPETNDKQLFSKSQVSITVFCELKLNYPAIGARIGLLLLTLPCSGSGKIMESGQIQKKEFFASAHPSGHRINPFPSKQL